MQIPTGDLLLAREYLELVASSNSEEVGRAADLLKVVKETIHNRNAIPLDDDLGRRQDPGIEPDVK